MISVCIIAKNEEQNIGRCLESLRPYDVEIVVVDTGSTDRTREIACQYTENVYDFVWCDDFAAAKNFAVSKAKSSYVLILDSDEYIEAFDEVELECLLQKYSKQVGRIERRNILNRNGQREESREWLNRIFPKEKFHYEGRIHEQVVALDRGSYDTYRTSIVIYHTGYDLTPEEKKKKTQRNLILLKRELQLLQEESRGDEKTCQEQIPYVLYQIGKSYYMAEDYDSACEYFFRGLSFDLDTRLEYVIDMVETYGYALINSGRTEEALFFENIYEEFGGSADFQFLMGLIYMKNAQFAAAVEEFEKAAKQRECRMVGVNDWLAYYNIGVIYECLGNVEQAKAYYLKCGEYEPARGRLGLLEE